MSPDSFVTYVPDRSLCPGNNESAGQHKSGKTRKGNRWLRTALIDAAAGASRAKNSALQARFRRVLRHRGPKKAVVALAHALLRGALPRLGAGDDLSRARRRLL
jgi:Transposase IS116/IS110/IS902 family